METIPAVSVLMGVRYRRPDTELLRRSVGSVLAQTLENLELVVCDDGSTDAAKAYLTEAARTDRRVVLVRPGDRLTLPEKLNACLRAARAPYIGRMDDDDWSAPDRFARQLAVLKQRPDIGFVGCQALLVRDGQEAGIRELPPFPTVRDFLFVQPFLHPALLFRREVLDAAGGYSEDPACLLCEDYDLLLRLYALGFRGMNMPEPLLRYSLSTGTRRTMRHRWNEAVTRCRRFRDLDLLPGAWPYVLKPLAVGLLPAPLTDALKRRSGR